MVAAETEELLEGMAPGELAVENARRKCRAARLPQIAGPSFTLATDTIVVIGDRVLGKPADVREAAAMLRRLSGREHEVISGVALSLRGERRDGATAGATAATAGTAASDTGVAADAARTRVTFAGLSESWIEAYLASGEWRGKAGAYAIQGLAGLFVEGIVGEYSNVVGLPMRLLTLLFAELGFDLVTRAWVLEAQV